MTKNTRDTAGGRAYLDLQNRARRGAYRQELGPFGRHLPERFAVVVAAAVEFVDPLMDGGPQDRRWDPTDRRWISQQSH
jgi:hypothetical protein